MEQWEHMVVQLEVTPESQQLFAYTEADGKVLLDAEGVSTARIMGAVNELGRQGFQLVGTDQSASTAGALTTYYLKRRLEEPATAGGGWVAGV